MGKNQYISLLVIFVIVVIVSILFKDPKGEEVVLEDGMESAYISELQSEVEELRDQIKQLKNELGAAQLDNIQSECENRKLNEEMRWLLDDLFIARRSMVEEGYLDRLLPSGSQLIYSETGDTSFLLLLKNEDGYGLEIFSNDERYSKGYFFNDLTTKEGFSISNRSVIDSIYHSLNGVITDSSISKVLIKQKELELKGNIVDIGNGTRLWFIDFDSVADFDSIKVEAVDINGEILWKYGIYEGELYSGRVGYD